MIKCNAIIRNLDDLRDFVERAEALLIGDELHVVPEFAIALAIWMDETVGKRVTHRSLHWDTGANEGRDADEDRS